MPITRHNHGEVPSHPSLLSLLLQVAATYSFPHNGYAYP
jgi:hypothetical protein